MATAPGNAASDVTPAPGAADAAHDLSTESLPGTPSSKRPCVSASGEGSARLLDVEAGNLFELGRALAKAYGDQVIKGLERSVNFYQVQKPVSCTKETWDCLSSHVRSAAEQCCPTAASFFAGVTAVLGRDAYLCLLDFEVYTLEIQRQEAEKAAKAKAKEEDRKRKLQNESGASPSPELVVAVDAGESSDASSTSTKSTTSSTSSSSSKSSDSSSSSGELCRPISIGKSMKVRNIGLPNSLKARPAQRLGAEGQGEKAQGTAADAGTGDSLAAKEQEAERVSASGHCTGFACVEDGKSSLVAQTVELPCQLYGYGDFDTVLSLTAPSCRVLVYDSDGRLCPIGMNAAGLGISVFTLHQTHSRGFEQPSLSVQLILWELFLAQHTLSSAMEWLRSLQLPFMCGSALLLADSTGAVNLELSFEGLSEVDQGGLPRPLVRANHPMCARSLANYGDHGKSQRTSEQRQQALASSLELVQQMGMTKQLEASGALQSLTASHRVRNRSVIACLVTDMQNMELHVQFKERKPVKTKEEEKLAQMLDIPKDIVRRLLVNGSVAGDVDRARLTTGEATKHLACWKTYKYSLKPPG